MPAATMGFVIDHDLGLNLACRTGLERARACSWPCARSLMTRMRMKMMMDCNIRLHPFPLLPFQSSPRQVRTLLIVMLCSFTLP